MRRVEQEVQGEIGGERNKGGKKFGEGHLRSKDLEGLFSSLFCLAPTST